MRIILVGQAAFAEKVLDGVRARGHEVAAVYCPPDGAGRVDPVKSRALALGVPVRQHRSLRGPEVEREFAGLRADLGVLAYVTQIVPRNVFETPRLGSICFHPSLLPRYRGGSAVNWQIIRGEAETGVTVFWVDPGIDTGPILLQKGAAIRDGDTAGSLYYETLFPLGVEAVLEAVDLVASGGAPRQPQDESRATYDPLCRDEHAAVDWSRPAREVFNLIRGCDPQPGAWVSRGDGRLRLYEPFLLEGGGATPGVVAGVGSEGIVVGASGGAVGFRRVRLGEKKEAAADFAAAHRLTPGQSL